MADDVDGQDVTGELTDAELQELFAAVDASEFEVVDEMLATVEARVRERNPAGNAEKLREYWLTGKGGRRIRWGTHGAFERCVQAVDQFMPGKAEGYCANLHHAATGRWPGANANKGKRGRASVDTDTITELGRVIEARGNAPDGGRVFRVRVIQPGDSANGRRYPESVLGAAAPLYSGARVFDGHRTNAELQRSAVRNMVGWLDTVEATADGLDADLHLLPGTDHHAAVLDASLAAQEAGRPVLAGISHDVQAHFRTLHEAGRVVQEATQIVGVNSADIVAVPAAGGRATRVLAGGEDPINDPASGGDEQQEDDVTLTTEGVLTALGGATEEQLSAVGLRRVEAAEPTITEPEAVREAAPEPETVGRDSILGQFMVRQAAEAAKLPSAAVDHIRKALPDRITEADVAAQIGLALDIMSAVEPIPGGRGPVAEVTQESQDKKRAALDAFFARDFSKGYRSFREAFIDFTGQAPRALGEDFNRRILRESLGAFDSARVRESADTTTWNLALGDSITRRMVAEYGQPSLQTWRTVVSSIVPVNDFRTQRIDRIGGYGTLPGVNQGAPYQPLTTPTNEEVTYAVTKRGGTEDVTLEMIANDDVRAISRIPSKLGLAAAITLYRFVWDFLDTNPNIYDSNALFTVGGAHTNSATNALSQSALSTARIALRNKAAYGDTTDILSLVPRTLIVVNGIEEIAFQLATSAVAIPATPAGPTDTPNIHQGLQVVTVDYWTSATKWIVIADPTLCPTFELGFYQGRENPELFTQSDPNFGSVFDADKVTWKIRHIYSGAVVDYRGFYRGNT